jgi:hypothetical protein
MTEQSNRTNAIKNIMAGSAALAAGTAYYPLLQIRRKKATCSKEISTFRMPLVF